MGTLSFTFTPQAAAINNSPCDKSYDFDCLARFGYGSANTGTWSEKYYRYADSGFHNCTRFAAFYLQKFHGMPDPGASFGFAWNWGKTDAEGGDRSRTSLKERGFKVDRTPRLGDVAWWDKNAPGAGSDGHVGVVIQVGEDSAIVASDSYRVPTGYANIMVITKSGGRWPTGFIHVGFGFNPISVGSWVLTNSLQPDQDTANRVTLTYGAGNKYMPLAGNWDGHAGDNPGVYNPANGSWILTNSLAPQHDTDNRIKFTFGGDWKYLPVVGDWNGDGVDTPGVFNPSSGQWVLTNSLRPEVETGDRIRFSYGGGNKYLPIAGDWDGNGRDSVGVFDPVTGQWVLTNSLRPDIDTGNRVTFLFGGGNKYLPVAGNWDGHGGDNAGVFNPANGRWVLTNSLQPDVDTGNRVTFLFGGGNKYLPVAGNWDGYRGDNAGVAQ